MAKQKTKYQLVIANIARQLGIKKKSVQKRAQRAVKEGQTPKIKGVTKYAEKEFRAVVKEKIVEREQKKAESVPEKIEEIVNVILYPRSVETGAAIYCPDAPNPFANISVNPGDIMTFGIKARFKISSDNSYRTINLKLDADEANKIKNAGSLYDALAEWTNTEHNDFLQGAEISDVSY